MERSGTDAQILARIRRGDTSAAIVEELGCSFGRIRELAKRHRIPRKTTGGAIAKTEGIRTVSVTTEARRVTPWARVAVPPSWRGGTCHVDYTDVDEDVIVIRRCRPDETPAEVEAEDESE